MKIIQYQFVWTCPITAINRQHKIIRPIALHRYRLWSAASGASLAARTAYYRGYGDFMPLSFALALTKRQPERFCLPSKKADLKPQLILPHRCPTLYSDFPPFVSQQAQ
jgi:hypothetical protein